MAYCFTKNGFDIEIRSFYRKLHLTGIEFRYFIRDKSGNDVKWSQEKGFDTRDLAVKAANQYIDNNLPTNEDA